MNKNIELRAKKLIRNMGIFLGNKTYSTKFQNILQKANPTIGIRKHNYKEPYKPKYSSAPKSKKMTFNFFY